MIVKTEKSKRQVGRNKLEKEIICAFRSGSSLFQSSPRALLFANLPKRAKAKGAALPRLGQQLAHSPEVDAHASSLARESADFAS